jgi:hypothetical protein
MDEKCKTVKDWRLLQGREEKRAEAKVAREQDKTAKPTKATKS